MVRDTLLECLNNEILKDAAFLIFANKQDLPGAKPINQLIEEYEFNKIKNHLWKIQPCSAVKGEGLMDGIKWLSEQLIFRGKNKFPNNPYLVDENEEEIIEDKNKNTQNDNSQVNLTVNSVANINTNITMKNDVVGEINKIEEKQNEDNNNINNINNINNDNI